MVFVGRNLDACLRAGYIACSFFSWFATVLSCLRSCCTMSPRSLEDVVCCRMVCPMVSWIGFWMLVGWKMVKVVLVGLGWVLGCFRRSS